MLSRWTCIVAALAPLMLLSPSMARAETAITTQAIADDGAFLPSIPRQRSFPAFACWLLAST